MRTCRERSRDKSLFPTCDFFMFGDLVHLGAAQEWSQNGQTPGLIIDQAIALLAIIVEKYRSMWPNISEIVCE